MNLSFLIVLESALIVLSFIATNLMLFKNFLPCNNCCLLNSFALRHHSWDNDFIFRQIVE